MDKQIQLTLTIDGKEAIGTLNMTDQKLKQIIESVMRTGGGATSAIGKTAKEFHGMNQVVGQTGFLLSDMDMFFRSNDWATNIRMGAMSVGNNFSMVAQTFANTKANAEAAGLSMKEMFKGSLSGMNAWMIGINAALFLFQVFTRFLESGTKEIKKQADEVKRLGEAYSKYTLDVAQRQKDMKNLELAGMDKYPGQDTYTYMGKTFDYGVGKYSDPARAKQLLTEIAALERVIFLTNNIGDAENRLSANRLKLKQITKENFEALVPMSAISKDIMEKWGQSELRFTDLRERNFQRAKEQLDLWIKQDEKLTEKHKIEKDKTLELNRALYEANEKSYVDYVLTLQKKLEVTKGKGLEEVQIRAGIIKELQGVETEKNKNYLELEQVRYQLGKISHDQYLNILRKELEAVKGSDVEAEKLRVKLSDEIKQLSRISELSKDITENINKPERKVEFSDQEKTRISFFQELREKSDFAAQGINAARQASQLLSTSLRNWASPIKNANSLLQQMINLIIQAIAETLIYKGILLFLNLVSGASGAAAGAAGVGSIVPRTDPQTWEKASPSSFSSSRITFQAQRSNYSPAASQQLIILGGEVRVTGRGPDLIGVIDKRNTVTKKYF
ncbi:hypothetical protein C0389_00320 [bacterium]|nr:hypothetical protein [bacterium]